MKLLIDNREPQQIIKYIEALNKQNNNKFTIEIKTLDIGDYIFYDDVGEKTKVIIERKSLSDLESSIKDGRYSEQSYRLNNSNLHNHNIIYLIEGNIQNYKKADFKSTIYSSIFSLNYYKGFSVICSNNNIETGEIIFNFICKLIRECDKKKAFYSNELDISMSNSGISSSEYIENIKISKKSNITVNNIFELMLMQIPGISLSSAKAISDKYMNMTNLLNSLRENPEDFDNIKLSNGRKINKNICDTIKIYLLI